MRIINECWWGSQEWELVCSRRGCDIPVIEWVLAEEYGLTHARGRGGDSG
jgi:hypothetical protein